MRLKELLLIPQLYILLHVPALAAFKYTINKRLIDHGETGYGHVSLDMKIGIKFP